MRFRLAVCLAAVGLFSRDSLFAQNWRPIGPAGGDVRTLAADPHDPRAIYLGTQDGHVFGSYDGGEHWQLLGRAGGEDSVVFAILVDSRHSQHVFAATWALGSTPGGVFRSEDGGKTWQRDGLTGESVRALAQSASNPEIMIAGTLSGVFRTADMGRNWERISPERHEDLRNFDSVAVDPRDPRVIYAGTYHLAWKTTDGGRQWFPIHAGMVDDSDVMSLSLDPSAPEHVFGSACSGIYHSDNGALLWSKYKGIPNTARRTHILREDPKDPNTLYAATTEGLWKTTNAGAVWNRITPANWSIGTMLINPQNDQRLVVSVEGEGIYLSDDGGKTYRASNDGFNHRQITDVAYDREHPQRMLVLLTNSAEPALMTQDGGKTWSQAGFGLKTAQLRHVYAGPDTWWATLTTGGLLRFDAAKGTWIKAGIITAELPPTPQRRKGVAAVPVKAVGAQPFNVAVNDLVVGRELSFAATDAGLLISRDRGATWARLGTNDFSRSSVHVVRASLDGKELVALGPGHFGYSRDGGRSWTMQVFTNDARGKLRLFDARQDSLLVGADNGMFLSRDMGQSWERVNLPQPRIQDLAVAGSNWLASTQGGLYLSQDHGKSWAQLESHLSDVHMPVLLTRSASPTILAASSTEGLMALEGSVGAAMDAKAGSGLEIRAPQPKD